MNERLKVLRKSINLSQEKFGERLGVTGAGISKIESGDRSFTEQMIKAVCLEFGVDYMWLTTGEGEMFVESDSDTMDLIDRIMFGENEFHKNLFKTFAKLDESELTVLEGLLDKFIEIKNSDCNQSPPCI